MSELDKLRVGIVGPSWWVNYWHLPALEGHPKAEIVAVCGATDRDSAEVKKKYGASAQFFTNIEQMLDEAKPQAIVVCTPNDLHHEATMAALRRGIHVTCEKPVALNAQQAREMADTAQSNGLVGMTNFPYRDNPNVQTLRKLIAEGYIGKVLHVSGQYHGGFGLSNRPNWRGSRARSGPGILGDLGSHLIDLARFVTGDEFSSVCAHSNTVRRDEDKQINGLVRSENPVVGDRNDDSCAFLAEFASGAQGIFHTSWIAYQGAYVQHQELEIYGSGGRLHFIATHSGTSLRGLRSGEKRWETIAVEGITLPGDHEEEEDYFRPGRHSATNTTYRWIDAIVSGASRVSPDLVDGLRAQQVIDAVVLASAERRWVDVSKD